VAQNTSGGKGQPVTTNNDYTCNVGILGGVGPIGRLNKITANNLLLYTYDGVDQQSNPGGIVQYGSNGLWNLTYTADGGSSSRIRIYFGTQTQAADDLIAANLGLSAQTPAFLGRWYIVLQGFDLTPFGGQVPNFTFEVYNPTVLVSAIVTQICGLAGIPSALLNLTALSTLAVTGYVIPERTTAAAALQELMNAFAFDLTEQDGQLTAKLRNAGSVFTLSLNDVRFRTPGQPQPETRLKLDNQRSIPAVQEVEFFDTARRYAKGVQRATRQVTNTKQTDTEAYRICMSEAQGQQIAAVRMAEKWAHRGHYELQRGLKYATIRPGDIVTIPMAMGNRDVTIDDTALPLYGIVRDKALGLDRGAYDAPLGGTTSGLQPPTVGSYEGFFYSIIEGNAIETAFLGDIGLYLPCCTPDNQDYNPAKFTNQYLGLNGPGVYTAQYRATMGSCATTLPNWAGGSAYIDTSSTLTVNLIAGSLASTDLATLLSSFTNVAFVGNEIIQFLTATYIGEVAAPGSGGAWTLHQWQLSGLLRGRRGSEYWISQHGANEVFALYDNQGLRFTAMTISCLGLDLSMEISDPDGTVTTASIELAGYHEWPYAPALQTGSFDGSNNLNLGWSLRTRLLDFSLVTGAAGLAPNDTTTVRCDLLDAMTGNVALPNAFTVSAGTGQVTSAQIASIGLTPGVSPVMLQLRQYNSQVGFGYPLVVTFTP